MFPYKKSLIFPPSVSQAMVIEIPRALVWPVLCLRSDSQHFITSVHLCHAAAEHPQEKSFPLLCHGPFQQTWRCFQDFFLCFGEGNIMVLHLCCAHGSHGGLGQEDKASIRVVLRGLCGSTSFSHISRRRGFKDSLNLPHVLQGWFPKAPELPWPWWSCWRVIPVPWTLAIPTVTTPTSSSMDGGQ